MESEVSRISLLVEPTKVGLMDLNKVSFMLALKESVFGWLQDGQDHEEEDLPSLFLKRERNFIFFTIMVLAS